MRLFMAALLAAGSLAMATEQASDEDAAKAVSLAELAGKAEVIALVQARDTDYLRRRDIPVSGSAYLRVLIPYKVDRTLDIIEVYEKGLHENECYFPNPTVFEEGRRYLVFLKKDPESEERYRGLEEGCAIEVLVRDNNRYAVRYPVTGIELSDPLDEYAEPMSFGDAYAIVDDEELLPSERDALLEAGLIAPHGEAPGRPDPSGEAIPRARLPERSGTRWTYTHGIDLSKVRKMMGPGAISTERHLKRPD